MKKIFYAFIAVLVFSFTTREASAQPMYKGAYNNRYKESFFYYPQSNVYYSFKTHDFIYQRHNRWVSGNRLPRHIRIDREPRLVVEHRGYDVWNDNRMHTDMYRNHRDGWAKRDGGFGAPPADYGHHNNGGVYR